MKPLETEAVKKLYKAISLLNTEEEVSAFMEDLCTIREVQDMAQRLETAKLLDDGISYNEVDKKVGISTATISRVSKCLNYGTGGYRTALDKLKENENK